MESENLSNFKYSVNKSLNHLSTIKSYVIVKLQLIKSKICCNISFSFQHYLFKISAILIENDNKLAQVKRVYTICQNCNNFSNRNQYKCLKKFFVIKNNNNNLYNSHSKTNPFETKHLIRVVFTQKLFKVSTEFAQSPTIHS